jgi:hypothetical protein
MKATVRMMKGGTGDQSRATYKALHYLFNPIKGTPRGTDRVSWIGGNLDGYGAISRKASLMALALDFGHEHLPGRRSRHLVVSCEPCEEADRADAEHGLRESAPLLAAVHGARRWIAVIHQNTARPHMHLLLANFDEERCRRFDFRRVFLSSLQDMDWTPFLAMGKGSRTQNRGPRGEAIHQLRLARLAEDPVKRAEALEKLHTFLSEHSALGSKKDALVATLNSHQLPPGWDGTKLTTKLGKPRAKPSIVVDGIEIRLVYYQRYARGRGRDLRRKDKKSPRKKPPSTTEIDGPTL